jgi:hypothetical protein
LPGKISFCRSAVQIFGVPMTFSCSPLAVPNPYDFDLIWLNSILNRNIAAVAATPEQLFQAINRRYRHSV